MSTAHSGPIVAIALRGGGSLDVWDDRVVANGHVYAIAELTGAGPLGDFHAAGARTAPALVLRGPDGAWTAYAPADPPDVERALQAIYQLRPDLRAGPPPSSPRAPAQHQSALADGVTREQALLACIAHLSIFFAPFLVPLLIWLALQPTQPYPAYQAKQAFVFHLATSLLAALVCIGIFVAFFGSLLGSAALGDARVAVPALVGLPLIMVLGLAMLACIFGFSIYAAVQTLQGRPFHYPLLGRL